MAIPNQVADATLSGDPSQLSDEDKKLFAALVSAGLAAKYSEGQILFRGERSSVTPATAFTTGIRPKGDNTDLLAHLKSNTVGSNFVSASKLMGIANQFAGKNGWIYVLQTNRGIDVNLTLGAQSPFPEQHEVAIPGGVFPREVLGTFPKYKGVVTGEFIPNPAAAF